MPNRFDGGRVALAGFLYQIIAVYGLRVVASIALSNESSDDLTAVLLLLPESGDLIHETMGQDAAIIIDPRDP